MTGDLKKCIGVCEKELPFSEFATTATGHMPRCRPCHKVYTKMTTKMRRDKLELLKRRSKLAGICRLCGSKPPMSRPE